MGQPVEQVSGAYQVFRYEKPTDMPGGKAIVQLAGSDIIRGRVQVVREGVRTICTRTVAWMDSGWS